MLKFNTTMDPEAATQNEELKEAKHEGSFKRLLENEQGSIQGYRTTNF